MRVLWFTDWQPPAVRRRLGLPDLPGPQAWVDTLADRLSQEPGVDLSIATTADPRLPRFTDGGVAYEVVPLPAPRSRWARLAADWRHQMTSPEAVSRGAALVRELAPDVVHVHGTEGVFGLLAPRVAPLPCVISLQGILQAYQRRYFAGRSSAEVARLAASAQFLKGRGVLHRYWMLRRQAVRERDIMRSGRWFIGRTGWDRRVLAAVNPGAAYFHCDEIMRAEFYAARWSAPTPRGARIYTTSSALLGKGTETLLVAVALLARRGRPDVRLRVAGVQPGSEVDGLYRRAARRLGVDERIDWLGRLDAGGIVAELLAADVFAYPSHVDNSPNSVVEAMLVGAPIVASRVGGIPSLMKDGEEGLLVPRGDTAALAAALGRLLDDHDAAVRFAAAARATALRRNDPEHIVARMLEVYAAVMAHAGAERTAGAAPDAATAAMEVPA